MTMAVATERDVACGLDRLVVELRNAARHMHGQESPHAAILWTDPDEQWRALVHLLQEQLPQLFVLGDYVPAARRGPAIWLKCIVDRTVDVGLAADAVPILYLPGIGRQQLRGTEAPSALGPLVELQYRGAVWSQRNGKDWTVEAFVVSDDGLGLPMVRDERTRQALREANMELMRTPLQHLQGKPLRCRRPEPAAGARCGPPDAPMDERPRGRAQRDEPRALGRLPRQRTGPLWYRRRQGRRADRRRTFGAAQQQSVEAVMGPLRRDAGTLRAHGGSVAARTTEERTCK